MAARDASPSSTSSTLSNITVRTEKQVDVRIMSSASPSISTPPTSLDDEYSVLSDNTKAEHAGDMAGGSSAPTASEHAPGTPHAPPEVPASEGRRSARSSRKSVTTYNVQILAGTAIHTPTKYLEKHHKNVLHGSLEAAAAAQAALTPAKKRALKSKAGSADFDDPVEEQLAAEAAQAARRRTSSRVTDLRKEALRNISGVGQAVASALSDSKALVQNSLRRTASDSALKSSKAKRPLAALGDGTTSETEDAEERKFLKPKSKLWLRQGLYVGQHRDFDPRLSESQNRARKRAKRRQDVDVLPQPMFAADRVLNEDPHHVFKDFKLPFDTYHPLPRKVKVDGWTKLNKSLSSPSYPGIVTNFHQTGSLATHPPCGSETSKIHHSATAIPRMHVAKPAITASWHMSAMIQTVGWELMCVATAPLLSSSDVPRETAMIMASRSWTLRIAVSVCAQ
jgi:palmitoyltransferase ZDHHC9/14/18